MSTTSIRLWDGDCVRFNLHDTRTVDYGCAKIVVHGSNKSGRCVSLDSKIWDGAFALASVHSLWVADFSLGFNGRGVVCNIQEKTQI